MLFFMCPLPGAAFWHTEFRNCWTTGDVSSTREGLLVFEAEASLSRVWFVALFLLVCVPEEARAEYTLFEAGPVRPLALSPDGLTLFVCNAPDGQLEIFSVTPNELVHVGAVPVGLEPVAVAARTNGEVWVVNHLSDSISIVDVPGRRVTRTLLVGDEPRDIVFGGSAFDRAFITAAHRGQNRPGDPQLLAGGVGRSDVWVFDANALGAPLGGTPLAILSLFGDTPRALAVTPDGATVYAAVFHSGNQTTTAPAGQFPIVPQIGPLQTLPLPAPATGTLSTPFVGVMLKQQGNTTTWKDANGASHANKVPFSLPDHDVFVLDANATPPVQTSTYDHVGTVLFNMAVNPVSGALYVSSTDANNMDRFEGFGATNLRGELHKARISILTGGSAVATRHLNRHINYAAPIALPSDNAKSLGIPTALAVTGDGQTLFVAAYGSQAVGAIDVPKLALDPNDPNAWQPDAADHIALAAGGPSGIVLDDVHDRMYVYTRFDNGVSVIDSSSRTELTHLRVHNTEPQSIVVGRPFLYDTRLSSSNGEASCGVCHVFGDFDSLAWDLGAPSPQGQVLLNNNPFIKVGAGTDGPAVVDGMGDSNIDFHPLKGPLMTQTLRGMEHNGPMHWRGDRSGGTASTREHDWDPMPDATASLDETLAFGKFNGAFVGLLGRATELTPEEMAEFTAFVLKIQLPPNPIRNLDNSLTASQAAGMAFYSGPVSDTVNKNCAGCHKLDPSIGAFGTDGRTAFSFETQHFKAPHLRNQYQKVGMFGRNSVGGMPGHGSPTTEQVRGFGFLHDGSTDTVESFLSSAFFSFPNAAAITDMANFMLAFPSDLAPIVGQQVTLRSDSTTDPDLVTRLNLLVERAGTDFPDVDRSPNKECDLVVKGRIGGAARGWWMSSPGTFTPDSSADAPILDADLRQLALIAGQDLTYTCAPPGSGVRMGIDRGGVGDASAPDGILDRDQCGDASEDGVATSADVAALRALLVERSTPPAAGKCNVAGPPGSDLASCDILDVVVLRRALAGEQPPLSSGCNG
jgi:YVTN family beta-propeller protein